MKEKCAWAHGKRMNLLGSEEWDELEKKEEERKEFEKKKLWPLSN